MAYLLALKTLFNIKSISNFTSGISNKDPPLLDEMSPDVRGYFYSNSDRFTAFININYLKCFGGILHKVVDDSVFFKKFGFQDFFDLVTVF